ncbi:PEP-CTERM sorting domain-containing protein [Methylobacillus gramineus]|uniref:PEP-CTERM sorting domain-containing protein n=1 Tax=Methylobacillus gramineus TaxID=755169 RepID=UPI001CFF7B6D|nr:PEP-CTERM sorting domain-containing protein [Methylobacillus gramineus]MCB5186024.1 PEP-CTERM sorting domain-containing protein [Methylobacillus gramineus]
MRLHHKIIQLALLSGLTLSANAAQAIEIVFDYRFDRHGWFSDSTTDGLARRGVLQQAASAFTHFSDSLSAITPRDDNSWNVSFQHPSWANWLERVTVNNLDVAQDSMVVFVGASSFNGSVLGAAGSGNVRASGDQGFIDTIATRGQQGAVDNALTDFGPWGGSIWFNSHINWYSGLDDPIAGSTQADLLTTVTHELAHLLGFGLADSWNALLQRNDQGYIFTGANAVAEYGAGIPVDGSAGHWAYGVVGSIDGQPVPNLMDPSTAAGNREYLSDLDYAALRDIGWQVSAVPEPSTIWMLLLGLVGVFGRWRRKTRPLDLDA